MHTDQIVTTAVALIIRATILAARWAGILRQRSLETSASIAGNSKDTELLFVRDRVEQLQSQVEILRKQLRKPASKPRYTMRDRMVVW